MIHTLFLHSDIFLPTHFHEYSVSVSTSNRELNLGLCKCLHSTACQECHADKHPSVLTIATTRIVKFNIVSPWRWCKGSQKLFWNYGLLQSSSQEVTEVKFLSGSDSISEDSNKPGLDTYTTGVSKKFLPSHTVSSVYMVLRSVGSWGNMCMCLSQPTHEIYPSKMLMDSFSRSTQWEVWNKWF